MKGPRFAGTKIAFFLIAFVLPLSCEGLLANEKTSFWAKQRKGANGDGGKEAEDWFRAAAEFGIQFIRLCPATWQASGRDFLLGDADNFTRIPSADLERLKTVLDTAQRHGVRVVLTMFSLPGARWRQQNDNKFDYRLWTEEKFERQALAFWKELAENLKDHPAVVGYNPLNEPHPARKHGFESGSTEGFAEWLHENKGSQADLNRFNRRMVQAIRQVDPEMPIILDCWFHAAPEGFGFLDPVDDAVGPRFAAALIYSFHFYAPWNFTTWRINKGRFSYPHRMPIGWSDQTQKWTLENLRDRVQSVVAWTKKFQIDPKRIMVGEFGCDRRVAGASQYLSDLIKIFNENSWHWAFYSFRSPDWDGMDYELGTQKLGWKYWQAREEGKHHEDLIQRGDNPLWNVFKREFRRPK